ncbi:MAG: hypothetical protein K2Y14_09160 [Burkholderiales bacterium]|nr:hypothetical protein [Burkholderiales bacterium]
MLKFIKENWLFAVISGATGSFIALLAWYIIHIKGDKLSTVLISAVSVISSMIVAVMANNTNKAMLKYKNIHEHQLDDKKFIRDQLFSLISEIDVKDFSNTKIEMLWQHVEKVRLFADEQNPYKAQLCKDSALYIKCVENCKIAVEGKHTAQICAGEKKLFNTQKEIFTRSVNSYFSHYTKTN